MKKKAKKTNKKTKVSIVKCNSYEREKVYNAVKKALKSIGFRFGKGSRVLLKPNILSAHPPEKAVTTHPAIIEAVCKILKQNKCKIVVGESSGWYFPGYTEKGFRLTGIGDAAKKYNAKVVSFKGKNVKILKKGNRILKQADIVGDVFDVDLVVNLPKMKTHSLTRFTGAVKNIFGCVPGGRKQDYHLIGDTEEKFSDALLDIYQHIKPKLNIMDAVVGLEGMGPGAGGKPKKTGLILASTDAVAMDIAASKVMGFDVNKIQTTKKAIERGLFPGIDYVEVCGDFNSLDKVPNLNYKKAKLEMTKNIVTRTLLKWVFIKARKIPVVNKKKCRKCKICANVCPAKVITLKPYPVFQRDKCIHCYCCSEMCPYNAMELRGGFISKLVDLMRKIKLI